MSYSARRAVTMYLDDQARLWECMADGIEGRASQHVPESFLHAMLMQRAKDYRERAQELRAVTVKVLEHVTDAPAALVA